MHKRHIEICACASRLFIDKSKVATLTGILRSNGFSVSIEPDLCNKIMQMSPGEEASCADTILACHPRAVRSLCQWKGLAADTVIDIRNDSVDDVLSQLNVPYSEPDTTALMQEITSYTPQTGADAWYPVLDKERCTECGKCHDFCLFGVYTTANKQVKVVNPQNCKNNCPACARMCPSKAIIFPKYEKSPINGGLEDEEQFNPQEMDMLYQERLRYRLQQRKAGVSLLNKDKE